MKGQSVLERFWQCVDKKPNGCWEWTAALRNGYGVLGVGGRGVPLMYAHRLSYAIHNGPFHKKLLVMHTCSNGKCVNPDHLDLGTHSDNLQQAWDLGERTYRYETSRWGKQE